MTKKIKMPGPDHPISINPTSSNVAVKIASHVVAAAKVMPTLKENSSPADQHIPRDYVDMSFLFCTEYATYSSCGGDCSYCATPATGDREVNAVRTYEDAYPFVASIKRLLAFYSDRIDEVRA